MRAFAFVFFFFIFSQVSAQRECGTQSYNSYKSSKAAGSGTLLKQRSGNLSSGITGRPSGESITGIIRIPVVVHVLYNTAPQNISDAQIKSGIAALNRDFRKRNPDTIATPQRFKALAADVQIEFYLATADANGVATTGIVRKQTSVPAWNMDDKIKFSSQGGNDAWDSKKYLNIWLGNTRRLLGYATMPGGDAKLDGLVINSTAFGTLKVAGPYNLGRTVVHEAGHWLGLQHIWGDESCGDDGVADTPMQGGYTTGCPNIFRSSCSNGTAGDMYMNYMDFTNDACMNLFTHGQKDRMRALFASGGQRQSILTSTGLNAPWATAPPASAKDSIVQAALFQVYPNPAENYVMVQCDIPEANVSGTLYLMNATGVIVKKIILTSAKQRIYIGHLQAGIYIFQGVVNNTKVSYKFLKQ